MNQESRKAGKSIELIRRGWDKPAVMCSFGKDSMVLLHLVREALGNVPVIYHRHPWFPAKNEFADSIIRSMGLEVHDYPPSMCGVKFDDNSLELVARYAFGNSGIDLPMNVEQPIPRRDFVCGLNDWMMRPKAAVEYPWRTAFIGHKSSDVDQFEGAVPLNADHVAAGGVDIVFPLRDWTDADAWDYIETNHVPYDKRRYHNRAELPDKWLNPDYLHACTKCIDPRNDAREVFCPKLNVSVPNVGDRVLRLQSRPDYIRVSNMNQESRNAGKVAA
jgi:3'-phosphoadenosine 5'-phosphosulfate sulfotransferase (PAPS reductase)/FAD synthetase